IDDSEEAKSIDQIPAAFLAEYTAKAQAAGKPLVVENGWLVCDGKLLTGRRADPDCWNSGILPQRAVLPGIGVTRFVPGRIGLGATDNLDELTDSMLDRHQAALEHHYGLWYERRRDDHERVRRIDGD